MFRRMIKQRARGHNSDDNRSFHPQQQSGKVRLIEIEHVEKDIEKN